jgi:hypothetical protein
VSWIKSLSSPVSAAIGECRKFNSNFDDRMTVVKMMPYSVHFSLSCNTNNGNSSLFLVFRNIRLTKGMFVTGIEPETFICFCVRHLYLYDILDTYTLISVSFTVPCIFRLDIGFEVLTPVVMKSTLFWDIKSCSPLKVSRHFGAICRLHL